MTSDSSTEVLDAEKGPCGICQGKFSEHVPPNIQHVWVSVGGDLMTHEQKKKQEGRAPGMAPGAVIRTSMGLSPDAVGKLTEILLEKGIISTPDALYVAGMGSKPDQNKLSGYRDPNLQHVDGSDNA
jgi:hypothetical protein